MKKPVFFIAGGDLRQVHLARMLAEEGYCVNAWGFNRMIISGVNTSSDFLSPLEMSDVIILPLPFSNDGIHLCLPLVNELIPLDYILNNINEKQLITGGKLTKDFREKVQKKGIKIIDYFEREDLSVKNVIPTAEGAIAIAIDNTEITIHGSNCLVCGYGRIGKVLSQILKSLSANVYICARSKTDIAWIYANGHKYLPYSELKGKLCDIDIVFNTVPAMIFDSGYMPYIGTKTLMIDLASKPGGIDYDAAQATGIRTIQALSLPGKVAPITSGRIIMETILTILNE